MKRKKIIIAIHILFVAICLITTGISAANLIGADSVQYKDTTVKAALDDLMDKVNANTCKNGAFCSKAKLGDYITMTPTSTSYTISKDLTGYNSDQTINPSELNLWRVIAINEDGTVDIVSEYASSKTVYFAGQNGYLNLIGALNTMAKQYENSNYTVGSRYTGYNGQTEYITDTSKIIGVKAPWKSSTNANCNCDEPTGRGDILYEKDTNLVTTALGTLVAKKVGTTTSTTYWLASRYYYYNGSSFYNWSGRIVDASGSVKDCSGLYGYAEGQYGYSRGSALRPIVTLKSDINEASGSGTSSDPWVLS